MEKKGVLKKGFFILLFAILAIVFSVGIFGTYFYFFNDNKYDSSMEKAEEYDSISAKSNINENDFGEVKIDESFIYSFMQKIGADELHAPPFSSDHPKIGVYIDDEIYNVQVIDKKIIVGKGQISNCDINIKTTKEEAIKMMLDNKYILDSFNSGKSNVEIVASQTTLFAKGYAGLYSRLAKR